MDLLSDIVQSLQLQNCKKCSDCKDLYTLDNFYKDHRGAKGRYSRCKKCHAKYKQSENVRIVYLNNISRKLASKLRSRLSMIVKNGVKSGSAVKDIGCTLEQLQSHLEAQFQPGMTWDNYGLHGWHVDHIQPLCKFDLTNREQFLQAVHYTNLQPLWAVDNWKKNRWTA